jgi:Cu/Ag efflux protein CusF
MYYLIYVSTAVNLMDTQELTEILNVSRKNNLDHNITGMLLYAEGTFIQVLEGAEEDVKLTYHNITKDDRHKNLIKLVSSSLEKRAFPEWSMGFAAIDQTKLSKLKGYISPDDIFFEDSTNEPAISIMKTFVENNNLTNSAL